MNTNEILQGLKLQSTTDNKKYCGKLSKIAALITEVKKLPWYTFELGPVISNDQVSEAVQALKPLISAPVLPFPRDTNPNDTYAYNRRDEHQTGINSEYGNSYDSTGAKDLIKAFPTYQKITIRYGDQDLTFGYGGEYTFDIPTDNAFCDYILSLIGCNVAKPATPDRTPEFRAILGVEIIKQIKTALPYTTKDTLRPAMLGVCLDFSGGNKVQIIATDAHRMYISDVNRCEANSTDPRQFILPSEACKKLVAFKRKDLDEPIELRTYSRKETYQVINGKYKINGYEFSSKKKKEVVIFTDFDIVNTSGGNLKIESTCITAKYPDFRCVVPDTPYTVEVDRYELIQHVVMNLPAANPVTSLTKFHFNGKCTISCYDIDLSRESISDFTYIRSNVETFDIAFNGKMLLEMLKGMDSKTVNIELATATRAAKFLGAKNETRLLMPLMLGL